MVPWGQLQNICPMLVWYLVYAKRVLEYTITMVFK